MSTMYNIKSYYRTLPYMIRRRLLDMIYVGKGLVKKYRGGGVGRSGEGVGHEVLSLVQGVGCAIFSYP